MDGKLTTRRPKMFLIYGYNRLTDGKSMMLNFPDRARGYLAYVGPNATAMRQVENTTGDLNLYFRPGEQILLFVNCRDPNPPPVSPYFVFYTKNNYVEPKTLPMYTYSLPGSWSDTSTQSTNNETLGTLYLFISFSQEHRVCRRAGRLRYRPYSHSDISLPLHNPWLLCPHCLLYVHPLPQATAARTQRRFSLEMSEGNI